jgi:hypothetical protein
VRLRLFKRRSSLFLRRVANVSSSIVYQLIGSRHSPILVDYYRNSTTAHLRHAARGGATTRMSFIVGHGHVDSGIQSSSPRIRCRQLEARPAPQTQFFVLLLLNIGFYHSRNFQSGRCHWKPSPGLGDKPVVAVGQRFHQHPRQFGALQHWSGQNHDGIEHVRLERTRRHLGGCGEPQQPRDLACLLPLPGRTFSFRPQVLD